MNIHLDRYKQQILESTFSDSLNKGPFGLGNPSKQVWGDEKESQTLPLDLGGDYSIYSITESLVDEIGDKTLDDLVTFLGDADHKQIITFIRTLLQDAKDQQKYRNQMGADEQAPQA
jgi:hypothetical protein